jgi:hypothetical protein
MLNHGMAVEASRFGEMVLKHAQVSYNDWVFCFDYSALQNSLRGLPCKVVMRPNVQPDSGGVIPDFLAFAGLEVDIPDGRATQRVNVRQTLLKALESFLRYRLGRHVELGENIVELLKNRSSQLSSLTRSALADRFERGNRDLARICGFPPDPLLIPPPIPSAVPLEELFSLQTQSTFVSYGEEGLATFLRSLLEVRSQVR